MSILCDFEEFAIYDTRIKPEKTDKASVARIHYFTYKDYEKNWDLITSVFSRDAVLKGSFDKYAEKRSRLNEPIGSRLELMHHQQLSPTDMMCLLRRIPRNARTFPGVTA